MFLNQARTGLIATLGPASDNPQTIAALIDAGANLFRLNFSHGTHDQHRATLLALRSAIAATGCAVGVLQDVQGPKLRVGIFAEGAVQLTAGQTFSLQGERDQPGDEQAVGISYANLAQDVQTGDLILLDDGQIQLRVRQIKDLELICEVMVGGRLSDRKGVNVPARPLGLPAITDKDLNDIRYGSELAVDWVALSFVRRAADVEQARQEIAASGGKARVMAKIEKPSAVEYFDEILAVSDAVMIARGDLGVELSTEEVPLVQKRLIAQARRAGKPVVTATQMLESMVSAARPTRAEASDVANAILDGSDALMLSAETAVGADPVAAIKVMDRIALNVENSDAFRRAMRSQTLDIGQNAAAAVAESACEVAHAVGAKAIVCFTASGSTAWRVARHRPSQPILALTSSIEAYQSLSLAWGVVPVLADEIHSTDDMFAEAGRRVADLGLAGPEDRYVVTAGVPFGVSGTTNLVFVKRPDA